MKSQIRDQKERIQFGAKPNRELTWGDAGENCFRAVASAAVFGFRHLKWPDYFTSHMYCHMSPRDYYLVSHDIT